MPYENKPDLLTNVVGDPHSAEFDGWLYYVRVNKFFNKYIDFFSFQNSL